MPNLLHTFLIGGALLVAGTATAQEGQSSEGPEIVVTGKHGFDRQVRDFVAALAQGPARGQLSRFELEVCPLTVGLLPAHNVAVSRRMRQVAKGVGMTVGSPKCAPNVLVAVVPDKREFIKGLQRKQPSLFNGMPPIQFRRLAREQEPVAAWQMKGLRSADGVDLLADSSFDIYINRTAGVGSRIVEPARPHFTAAVVVIELEGGRGLTPRQLADYAAMRAFARTDPSRLPASANSILTAVGAPVGASVPLTLTHWDLGFLRALYSSDDKLSAGMRRGEMRRILADELVGESDKRAN